ncbi:MAG: hypothetical protein JNJ52_04800 [Flavobacterium sp.]|nr:hypothetical protein [Flavobacterium sp.]
MRHTLKFIFSLLFVCVSLLGNAQEKKKDSVVPKTERFGVRFGVDLFKLTRSFYEKDYRGLELVGDYRLTKRFYIAAELGNENKTVDDAQVNFTTKGTYIKAGFDYNAYENWLNMENMIHIGLRYGVSSFSQTLNNYEVYNTQQYFGESPTIDAGTEFNGLSAQWAEVVSGVKVEVFNNIYVGFSLRLHYLFSNSKPENFDNLYIPGFNRTYNGNFGVGFNYTVSYFLPLYKSTAKSKETKPKEK